MHNYLLLLSPIISHVYLGYLRLLLPPLMLILRCRSHLAVPPSFGAPPSIGASPSFGGGGSHRGNKKPHDALCQNNFFAVNPGSLPAATNASEERGKKHLAASRSPKGK